MEDASYNSNYQFVQRIFQIFKELDLTELEKDIKKAINLDDKSKTQFVKSFLKKYAKLKIDGPIGKQILTEIIQKLVNTKQDFASLMEIYMATDDELKAEVLRHHFILKEKKLEKVQNGDTSDTIFVKFGISFSCLYDDESYYNKFIKGILRYFRLIFKENYLYEYIKYDYFKNLNEFKYYRDNSSSLGYSLKNMLLDIERVIFEHTNEEVNKNPEIPENKMTKPKFGVLQIRAHLLKNKEITSIYDKCKNNDEILIEIGKFIDKEKNNNNELYENLVIL